MSDTDQFAEIMSACAHLNRSGWTYMQDAQQWVKYDEPSFPKISSDEIKSLIDSGRTAADVLSFSRDLTKAWRDRR